MLTKGRQGKKNDAPRDGRGEKTAEMAHRGDRNIKREDAARGKKKNNIGSG